MPAGCEARRDSAFLAALRERTPAVSTSGRATARDAIFLAVEREAELARIASAVPALAERGPLRAVYPNGPGGVPDTAVSAARRAAGLTATKAARFSDTRTAEKLVRPRGTERA